MVKHYNTSIAEDAARILNSKQGQFLSDDVTGPVAVIPLSPRTNIVKTANRATTGTTTIYTTDALKDTYITGAFLCFSKNAACDVAATDPPIIRAVIDGVNTTLLGVAVQTLTAESGEIAVSFGNPIKLDRNSAVTLAGGTFTAGVLVKNGGFYGYTVETTK